MPTKRIKQFIAVAGLVAVLVAIGSPPSHAASHGAATLGEAQGVFRASFTGGSAIRAHNHLAEGVPGVPLETTPDGARILNHQLLLV